MSSQRVSTWSTTQPDPLCVNFSSVSWIAGKAWLRAPSISLVCRAASCLWRITGLTYSSLPSGLSFRSCALRASWNLTLVRASIYSSSLAWICGCTPSRKALGSAPLRWPWGTSICHLRRYAPMFHCAVLVNRRIGGPFLGRAGGYALYRLVSIWKFWKDRAPRWVGMPRIG